jgi:hypothetical protein
MVSYAPKRRFGHRLRLTELRVLWWVPVAAVLLAFWVFFITGDPLRMLLAVPTAGLLWLLLFLLGWVGYWVELSGKGLRFNRVTSITPGGPIGSQTSVQYRQMRSLTVKPGRDEFGRVIFSLAYWDDKKATERTAEFAIEDSEVGEFIELLQSRTAERGIDLLILR